jgi:hypothetical protein
MWAGRTRSDREGSERLRSDYEQAVARKSGRLGERLGEGELSLEAPGGQVALVVELAGVGDPFVDQDRACRSSGSRTASGSGVRTRPATVRPGCRGRRSGSA